ncbi:MAG: ferritin-like domain-containing protein [Gammaproteobacteria bacterium]|nr:ferritin-like domain-containing protein [Gammaproteobacteria bacterium]
MSFFELAHQALMCDDVNEKVRLTHQLFKEITNHNLTATDTESVEIITVPGRPKKPQLVSYQATPKRDRSDLGMIKTIHSICHIEFNAINLALDALYRFRQMPEKYYHDWAKVAHEEALHFTMLNDYLKELDHQYGDFEAHNGLWEMTVETDYDVLARMALVPRVLEARGLDVTPSIQTKFRNSQFPKMAEILEVIFQDEIGHVKIGNYWYKHLCKERDLEPIETFDLLIKKHVGKSLRGPFNWAARLLSDFTEAELEYLECANRERTN